jgi:hypothetical protein
VDLGVIDGRDPVVVPEGGMGRCDGAPHGPLDGLVFPPAALDESFQGHPVALQTQAGQGLRDGVLFHVQHQPGHPFGAPPEPRLVEAGLKSLQFLLPPASHCGMVFYDASSANLRVCARITLGFEHTQDDAGSVFLCQRTSKLLHRGAFRGDAHVISVRRLVTTERSVLRTQV